MKITLASVIHLLDIKINLFDEETDPEIEGIKLFYDGIELSPNILYIAELSALDPGKLQDGIFFMCLGAEKDMKKVSKYVAVCTENMTFTQFSNRINEAYLKAANWHYSMNQAVLNSSDVQNLLYLSESIIGNHIDVLDSSFKLVAATYNIAIDDEATEDLLSLGYHKKSAVEKFRKYHRLSEFSRYNISISTDKAISRYITVKCGFNTCGDSIFLAVMLCNNTYSRGVIDLFRSLCEYIRIAGEKMSRTSDKADLENSFISDILQGKISTYTEMNERAFNIGLSGMSKYCVILVRIRNVDNYPLLRTAKQLSLQLNRIHVYIYKNDILAICELDKENISQDEITAAVSSIQKNLGSTSADCGVSGVFSSITNLPVAYMQCSRALDMGEFLPGKSSILQDLRPYFNVYAFDDYAIYYQLYASKLVPYNLLNNTRTSSILEELQKMEKQFHIPYLDILYTHLLCERKATVTGQRLNMHRNTVIYHIERIEKLLGLSLEDEDLRISLLLAFKTREIEDYFLCVGQSEISR